VVSEGTKRSVFSVIGVVAFWAFATGATMAQSGKPVLAYQLTHVDTGEPFPSPDGKKILFASQIAGSYQLFTMNADGSGIVQVTHDPWNHDTPSWSPDGKKLAFVSDQNKHSVVYMMNVDGTGLERLSPENAESIHPNWSPDSTRVIYCADDDLNPPRKNDASIYSVDVKSKETKTLITGGVNTYPSWSPDGKKIVFRKMIGDMNSEVYVANADGSELKNLSNHMAFDGWPAWSPDGKQIAFSSNRRANYQIHIMNADGSGVRVVANTEGRATEPRWSPNGKTIYFTNCKKVDFGVDCQVMAAALENQ
jgi:Tol biopolymer transport system component